MKNRKNDRRRNVNGRLAVYPGVATAYVSAAKIAGQLISDDYMSKIMQMQMIVVMTVIAACLLCELMVNLSD